MKAGETMIDVGANMGGYSLLAASKGVNVIAFEPEAENYALLQKNIMLNRFNVVGYCAAITENFELSKLGLSQAGAGGSCHSFGKTTGITQGSIGLSLDQLGLSADHVKIDVDGREPNVIKGARKLLLNAKSILIEVDPKLPEHLEMIKEIESLGFEYDPAQVEKSTRKEGPFKGCAEYLFTMGKTIITEPKVESVKILKPKNSKKKVSEYVVAQIESTPINNSPFPHIYARDVFPQDLYDKMINNFSDKYVEIQKSRGTLGYPLRYTAPLVGEPWEEIQSTLLDGKLKKQLLEKFGIKDENFTEDLLLVRDKEDYSISPHTDIKAKVITALFYLPKEPNVFTGGTYLYEPLKKGFTCKTGKHYPFEQFKSSMHFGLIPNTMLAFARTDNSFHGVEPSKNVRDVLLYNIRRDK